MSSPYSMKNLKKLLRSINTEEALSHEQNHIKYEEACLSHMEWVKMDVLDMFEYSLPETIKPEHIEIPLYENGYVVITKHMTSGLPIAMACSLLGRNIHGEYTRFKINATDEDSNLIYEQEGVIGVDGVVIRNNKLLEPTSKVVELYARRLANVEITSDINVYGLRTPLILEGSEEQMQDMKQLLHRYNNYEPAIIKRTKPDLTQTVQRDISINAISTGVTPLFNDLHEFKHHLKNELYTRLGINNTNQLKKERQVVDEVNANNEQVERSQTISLVTRKQDIELANKILGLSITVDKITVEEEEPENDDLENGKSEPFNK